MTLWKSIKHLYCISFLSKEKKHLLQGYLRNVLSISAKKKAKKEAKPTVICKVTWTEGPAELT